MWLDKLKELKKMTKMSNKDIAIKTGFTEKTVARLFSGETDNPYITTLIPIVNALNGSLDDIFADTNAVVGTEKLSTLQDGLAVIQAEKDILLADYEILKGKYDATTKELELLKTEFTYTKKLLAVHEYYTKLKGE